MLRLDDTWVWDSWYVDDGQRYHAFYLQAPSSLPHETHRHLHVSIGHAVSDDLTTWGVLPDALHPAPGPRWDDSTTWTGSVVRAPDGRWLLYYTGTAKAEGGLVQRIGVAASVDLLTWERVHVAPLEADPSIYEKLGDSAWHDEAWRDPYVFADPDGRGWHMLVTARARTGPVDGRGVIAHATSPDLSHWTTRGPITEPGSFGLLEVPAVHEVDGKHVAIFSCRLEEMPVSRHDEVDGLGGVWSVAGPGPLGPFDVARAVRFPHPSLYAGRLVRDRSGTWQLLGFRYLEGGEFIGQITDPIPVTTDARGIIRA